MRFKRVTQLMMAGCLMIMGGMALAQTGHDASHEEILESVPQVMVNGIEYRPDVPRPEIPVVLDGVRYEPEEFARLDLKRAYFLVSEESVRDGVVYAFSRRQLLRDYVGSLGVLSSDGEQAGELRTKAAYESSFFTDKYFSGLALSLPPGGSNSCLNSTFNNEISSVSPSSHAGCTVLYDGCFYTGSFPLAVLPGDYFLGNLGLVGWNDRASSLRVLSLDLGCGV